jgi:hypothetical protein
MLLGLLEGLLSPTHLCMLAAVGLLVALPFCLICAKAGFPGALGLLVFVPVANLVLLFFLAFAEWPALRRARTGVVSAQDPEGTGPGPRAGG